MRCVNTPKKVVKKSGCKLPLQSSARKRRATDVTKKCFFFFFFFFNFFTKHVLATWQRNSSRGSSLFLLAACLRLLTCVTRGFLLSECEISPMNLKTKGTEAYSNFTPA